MTVVVLLDVRRVYGVKRNEVASQYLGFMVIDDLVGVVLTMATTMVVVAAVLVPARPPLLLQGRVRHCRCSCRGVYHLVAATTAALFHKLRSRHFSTNERALVDRATRRQETFFFSFLVFFLLLLCLFFKEEKYKRQWQREKNRQRKWSTGTCTTPRVLATPKANKRSVHTARKKKTKKWRCNVTENGEVGGRAKWWRAVSVADCNLFVQNRSINFTNDFCLPDNSCWKMDYPFEIRENLCCRTIQSATE